MGILGQWFESTQDGYSRPVAQLVEQRYKHFRRLFHELSIC